MNTFSPRGNAFSWDGIAIHPYKEDGTHFKSIARQVLLDGHQGFSSQLRYFEIAPDGHSTLERHEHSHGVIALNGEGDALVGDTILHVKPFDVIVIPPMTWHQFKATQEAPFGFLCLVNCQRDRPQRPAKSDLLDLRKNVDIASFIRV